jgi:carbonic anhydrase
MPDLFRPEPAAARPVPARLERRQLLKLGAALGWATIAGGLGGPAAARAEALPTPKQALGQLMAGNQRFAQHRQRHPNQTQQRLQEVAQAQHPFVTVLSCADSRAPAEIIFDQGIGSIFDVRIAGNIATPEALGSIEYAVVLLGTPLLMVLGHERCGAVTAAVQGETLPGAISTFVQAILPAVEQAKGLSRPKDSLSALIDQAVTTNVKYQIEQLKRSPLLMARLETGQLEIIGGRYDLDSGYVTLV